jgi:diguanylate cyclase (GGDEF)-like protein
VAAFTPREAKIVRDCIEQLRAGLSQTSEMISQRLGGFVPRDVGELLEETVVIGRQLQLKGDVIGVHDVHHRLLKHAICSTRRARAESADGPRQMTFNREAILHLDYELRLLDGMMEQAWFSSALPARIPLLTDFLSLHEAEQALRIEERPPPRVRDEKFAILEAPGLFLGDLAYYRRRCGIRDVPLAVAYVDIDDFKRFNTRYTETRVDRDVLPRFMTALEAHVFAHGHAYRFGGDEYVVLLPNVGRAAAKESLRRFQDRLATLDYVGVDEKTTVSVGLCHIMPDCFLTDREIQAKANEAKNFAKTTGKNCVVTYRGPLFRDQDLVVS